MPVVLVTKSEEESRMDEALGRHITDYLIKPIDFDRLNGGERVTFEVQSSPKGPRAARVQAA